MAEVPLFISIISHIYLMNDSTISHMNDNHISHQRFTVVVPCRESAHNAHWLFLIFYNLNEYLKVPSGPLCWWTQDVPEFGHELGGY